MRLVRRSVAPLLGSHAGSRAVTALVRLWATAVERAEPKDALVQLLRLHDLLYLRIDMLAAGADGGVHVKHRLIRYHDFFVERVQPGERVLDVGCGKGELAYDLAERAGAEVVGIDMNPVPLSFAERARAHPHVTYLNVDAWEYRPDSPFDVVVLSNVLEHIDRRSELLTRLREVARPSRFLIRVPLLERDWLVPLRRELGLPHFLDPTHELEYDEETFRRELAAAGLEAIELQLRWGEIWAVAS